MGKLHELLAAVSTAKAQADSCRQTLMGTFEKKRHLFIEKLVTFNPNDEGAKATTEEQSDIQTTVTSELKWVADILAKSIDLGYQINESNVAARADVILDNGAKLMANVPTTALLELEKRANEIHALVTAIPTLDPAKGFTPDPNKGDGIFRAREDVRYRTKKTPKVIEKAKATDKHPAQVELIYEDLPVGTLTTQEWSGLITPAQKSDMLNRADELRRAFKTARSRANEAPASETKVASGMLNYVFGIKSAA